MTKCWAQHRNKNSNVSISVWILSEISAEITKRKRESYHDPFFLKISSGSREKCQEIFVLPPPLASQVRILALMQKIATELNFLCACRETMMLPSYIFFLVPVRSYCRSVHVYLQVTTILKGCLKNTAVKTFKLLYKYGKWDSLCYSMIPKLSFDAHFISCDYKKYCTWFTYLHLTLKIASLIVLLS